MSQNWLSGILSPQGEGGSPGRNGKDGEAGDIVSEAFIAIQVVEQTFAVAINGVGNVFKNNIFINVILGPSIECMNYFELPSHPVQIIAS